MLGTNLDYLWTITSDLPDSIICISCIETSENWVRWYIHFSRCFFISDDYFMMRAFNIYFNNLFIENIKEKLDEELNTYLKYSIVFFFKQKVRQKYKKIDILI